MCHVAAGYRTICWEPWMNMICAHARTIVFRSVTNCKVLKLPAPQYTKG